MTDISGVYQILNVVNGKMYIGSAAFISKRWSWHIQALKRGKHHSILMQRAWNKYGESNFQFTILQIVDVKELIGIEQKWMNASKCANPKFGYNIYPIAGRPLGKKLSEAHKLKISIGGKGKKRSEATKIKMREYHKNRPTGHKINHLKAMQTSELVKENTRKLKEINRIKNAK